MIIAIDTEELDRVSEFAKKRNKSIADYEISSQSYILMFYSKIIKEYYELNQKELAENGCLRNPVIIEDDNYINILRSKIKWKKKK